MSDARAALEARTTTAQQIRRRLSVADPPSVTPTRYMGVYYNPEERGALVTLHESWSIDDGHACYGNFPTQEEAEDCARRLGYRPVVMRGKGSSDA